MDPLQTQHPSNFFLFPFLSLSFSYYCFVYPFENIMQTLEEGGSMIRIVNEKREMMEERKMLRERQLVGRERTPAEGGKWGWKNHSFKDRTLREIVESGNANVIYVWNSKWRRVVGRSFENRLKRNLLLLSSREWDERKLSQRERERMS